MLTGWYVKWKLNRPLWEQEKDDRLSRDLSKFNAAPDDKAALVSFNSTYIEFVDRRFRLRGGAYTALQILSVAAVFCIFAYFLIVYFNTDVFNGFALMTIIMLPATLLTFWLLFWRKEFASPTYYPIRFNRKTRKVYVYRDKRDGGLLTLPWEEGFFHIGKGYRQRFLLDLRCHVLDGDIVKDTFPIGHYFDDPNAIKGMWAFICGYMEEGPKAVQPDHIMLSVEPTWKNCYMMFAASMQAYSKMKLTILAPFIYSLAASRWLVMKTCKVPVWPTDIEKECQVDPNDPYDMPRPAYMAEFHEQDLAAEEANAKSSK